jgi:hypothetical protein
MFVSEWESVGEEFLRGKRGEGVEKRESGGVCRIVRLGNVWGCGFRGLEKRPLSDPKAPPK